METQSLRLPGSIRKEVLWHSRCDYSLRESSLLTEHPPDEKWPELLQALFVASQSPDVGQRQSAFRIFTATPGIIEQQHETVVIGAFTKGFKDDDVSVRVQPLKS